jgi:ubiquinone/menaquinone biosynthesis C-methylase UbiE
MAEGLQQGAKGTTDDVYALDTGEAGAARLRLLDHVYGPATRSMLSDAGLKEGTRALDLACGIGAVTCWMASRVGVKGSVVAADINPDQLLVAKSHCAECRHPAAITYIHASAYESGLEEESFDLIHMRLLLCHLTEPAKVLREARRLLKPRGVLVCQDLKLSSIFCSPESSAYSHMIALCQAMGTAIGVNYDYGIQLPAAAVDAGFQSVEVRMQQPAYLRGPEKRLWEHTFAEIAPSIARAGVATDDHLRHLLDEMRQVAADERVLIAQACLPGVIAVK